MTLYSSEIDMIIALLGAIMCTTGFIVLTFLRKKLWKKYLNYLFLALSVVYPILLYYFGVKNGLFFYSVMLFVGLLFKFLVEKDHNKPIWFVFALIDFSILFIVIESETYFILFTYYIFTSFLYYVYIRYKQSKFSLGEEIKQSTKMINLIISLFFFIPLFFIFTNPLDRGIEFNFEFEISSLLPAYIVISLVLFLLMIIFMTLELFYLKQEKGEEIWYQ